MLDRPGICWWRPAGHRTFEVSEERCHGLLAEQLGIFFLLKVVDGADLLIGDFLNFLQGSPLIVFGDGVVFEQLLEPVIGVAADRPDLIAPFFSVLVHEARHFLPSIFSQRWNWNPDD